MGMSTRVHDAHMNCKDQPSHSMGMSTRVLDAHVIIMHFLENWGILRWTLVRKVNGRVCVPQVLVYRALGWQAPTFAHVSLILAPDKSKLSKRHGATSVGEFRQAGVLSPAMVNFLSLLGWNDGSEQEIFTTEELQSKFSLDRITKSPAVFDNAKLVRCS